MVALFPIACEELGHIGVPRQMRRCRSHHGGCTRRVANAWAHMGCPMVHGGISLSFYIQLCIELCHVVQCYTEECRDMYLSAVEDDDA